MGKRKKLDRPNRVKLLVLLLLWIAVWNGIRLANAVVFWKTLKSYGTSPLYIAVSGGVWLAAGLIVSMGLWRGKAWSWAAALGGAAGYTSWYWFDRLVLQEPRANWPFAIIVTVLLLIFVSLSLLTYPTRIYLQKTAYERTTETSNPA